MHDDGPEVMADSSEEQIEIGEEHDGGADRTPSASLASQGNKEGEHMSYPSHFANSEAHPIWLRYGMVAYLLTTTGLLIYSGFFAGVRADYILRENDRVEEQRSLFTASIVSSVGELWENESYPLAILIAITSVGWPYVELSLLMFSWVVPVYTNARRRERLLEILDMTGKWSFVDIVVLAEIIAAFRQTIFVARGVYLEIVIVPESGFYGFIVATMLSLMATDIILFNHRKVVYESCDKGSLGAMFPMKHKIMAGILVMCAFSVYLAGCFPDIYTVENTRGNTDFVDPYSVISVGTTLSNAEYGDMTSGLRFLQFMWFFLCMAAPLCSCIGFGILNVGLVSSLRWQRIVFLVSEAFTAWSCAEVFILATLVSILQLPTFGEGLIESDCSLCFSIDSSIKPEFALLCVGMVLLVLTNLWLYRTSHGRLYKLR